MERQSRESLGREPDPRAADDRTGKQQNRVPSVCFLDTEFNAKNYTGQNGGYQEITEIGAVIFQNGKPADSFQRYCKLFPRHSVTKRCSRITGITQELLDREGVPFQKAMSEFLLFLNQYDVKRIYAFGTSDRAEMFSTARLNQLGSEAISLIRQIRNVYPEFSKKLKLTCTFSLNEICEVCRVNHGDRAHSARYDAEDTGLAYYNMRRGEIDENVKRSLKEKKKKKVKADPEPESVSDLLLEEEKDVF